MNTETILVLRSYCSNNVSSPKASLMLCDEIHSNPFIDAVLYSYKGLFFEISLKNIKILLLYCNQKTLFQFDSVFGSRETKKIKVGFHVLGNTITPFGNIKIKKNNSDILYLNNYPIKHFFFSKYNSLFSKIYTYSKRNYNFNTISSINSVNIVSNNFNINIDFLSTFNSYSDAEKLSFIIDTFNKHFIFDLELNNPLIYKNNYNGNFIYITDNTINNNYFYEILDFNYHQLNNLNIYFYSICIITNASFLNVKKDTSNIYSYDLCLYFINFHLPVGTITNDFYISVCTSTIINNYLSNYFDKNKFNIENKIIQTIKFLKINL